MGLLFSLVTLLTLAGPARLTSPGAADASFGSHAVARKAGRDGSRSNGRSRSDTAGSLEGRLHAPPGLRTTVFARVPGARFMVVGPDGAVYVSQPSANKIIRLLDTNGDGIAETVEVAVAGLNRPQGMAFHGGWLYVANTDGVVRLRLDRNGRATGRAERVNRYSGGGGHWTRTVVFGPDSAMYVSLGSSCNLCVERDSDRAAVMRYDETGRNGHVFARGLRNAEGLAFEPTTHALWVTQNERDNLPPDHEDLPPEEINILREGGDYGWPYCYGDRVPNPEYHDRQRCERTIAPALQIQAHSAPLGIAFLRDATQLPQRFRGDALVALHGSWNRHVPTGAKIIRVRVENGLPVGYEDFVTGWQLADGSRWGRPVDVVVLKDGSVLISDDTAGEMIRVARE